MMMPAPKPVKRFYVLGNPIAQSRSPEIHAAFAVQVAEQINWTVDYQRHQVPFGEFTTHINALRMKGVSGVNVTVPFKLDAFSCATRVSTRAALARAANTLKFDGDEIYADNTDGVGLLTDITKNLKLNLRGKNALLLGAGGAAMGVAGVLLDAQLAGLSVLNRSHDKAIALAANFAKHGNIAVLQAADLAAHKFDVVINATSAALTPMTGHDAITRTPIWANLAPLRAGGLAYDMMYGATPTAFMVDMAALAAKNSAQITVADGLGMLVEQAAEAFNIWHSVRPQTMPVIAQIRAQLTSK